MQVRLLNLSQPIKTNTTFNCLHCMENHICDPRNRGRQSYCRKPECRQASKAASQRRWVGKPQNANYFRGTENCERVRLWRKEHPGYWRRKPVKQDALQDPIMEQVDERKDVVKSPFPDALQDLCCGQPALLVGIISMMTGSGLQEDIAANARSLLTRGEDVLRMVRRGPHTPEGIHERQQSIDEALRIKPHRDSGWRELLQRNHFSGIMEMG